MKLNETTVEPLKNVPSLSLSSRHSIVLTETISFRLCERDAGHTEFSGGSSVL